MTRRRPLFGSTDQSAPERRALQISASFLDGCPAGTVLEAADALLADPDLNWPPRQGGPLAGADDNVRCDAADIHFGADGTVSASRIRPGIDRALLKHTWARRPQLVPVLTRWLSEISKPRGIAEQYPSRLADVLASVAVLEGPDAVLDLAHDWLRTGTARHFQLAVDVVDRLSIDPVVGAAVRKERVTWARGQRAPERQRAVVAVCRGRLGEEYTGIALTRLKYVLETPGNRRSGRKL